MSMIQLDNIEIYYEIFGEGEPIILIAGYTCDHQSWSMVSNILSAHFKVIVFDNRAIGQTIDDGKSFSIERMADDVFHFMQKLNIENPYIVGQSMGGAIAQMFAIKYPDQLKKLIILNSVMQFNLVTQMALKHILSLNEKDLSFEIIIEAILPWIVSKQFLSDQKNIDQFKQMLISAPYPQSLADQKRQFAALCQFNSSEIVSKINIPTLVVASEEDVLTIPSECKKLADKIHGSQFKIIPGAHASQIEQAEKLAEIILSFCI